jgi:hypothetical protein
MNSYAVIAFSTPVAALLMGWAAVAMHRRSLRRSHEAETRSSGQAPAPRPM